MLAGAPTSKEASRTGCLANADGGESGEPRLSALRSPLAFGRRRGAEGPPPAREVGRPWAKKEPCKTDRNVRQPGRERPGRRARPEAPSAREEGLP